VTRRVALVLDLALKVAVLVQLAIGVALRDEAQFEGKDFAARVLVYPVAILVVPAVWWALGQRRPRDYPYALDILWTLPFVVDVTANTLNLYEKTERWDEVNHLLAWVFVVAGVAQVLSRLPLGRLEVACLAVGFGAVSAIVWELAEYLGLRLFREGGYAGEYKATLADLTLALCGSVLAAVLTATILWPTRRRSSRAAVR
jgi:hypothetical protein